jgi:hypothetical protein
MLLAQTAEKQVTYRKRRRQLRLLDLARPLLRLAGSLVHGAAAGLLAQGVLLALAAGLAHWRGGGWG